MLEEFLIQNSDFTNRDIASLSDTPSADGMTADALKNRFDASTKHIVMPKFNAVIEALVSTDGALNVGATEIEGVAGVTVQDILVSLKELVDTKSDFTLTEEEIATKFDTAEAQDLIKSITFDDQSGIFTITQYDGTIHTIDTALEKVALNVRLDGQQFVLTLVDGTEQRVDLSEFLTQYEFTDSNTIAFSVVNGSVNANIKPRSIGNTLLDEEVTAFITEQNTQAKASADASAVSATSARTSENNARASYLSALQCQDNACTCATNASISEENASASATSASLSAELARQAADEAQAVVGDGIMLAPVYDTHNKKTDIFDYVDTEVSAVNSALESAVADINADIDGIQSQIDNDLTMKHLLSFDGTNISEGETVLTFDVIHEMLMDTPAFVVLVYEDKAYHPNVVSTSAIVFSSTTVSNGNLRVDRITLSSNDTVTTTYGVAEKTVNKVDAINDTNKGNTEKYPSNKAVVDYVGAIEAKLNTGMSNADTTLNEDGSITEVTSSYTCNTVFNTDGSIVETFNYTDGTSKIRTTVFDGNEIHVTITEVV